MSRTGTASFGTKSGVGGLWGAGLHLPELPLSGFVLRVLPHHGGINPGAPGHSELPWSLRAWDGDEEQRGPSPRAGSSTDQAVTPSLGTGFLGEAPVLGELGLCREPGLGFSPCLLCSGPDLEAVPHPEHLHDQPSHLRRWEVRGLRLLPQSRARGPDGGESKPCPCGAGRRTSARCGA